MTDDEGARAGPSSAGAADSSAPPPPQSDLHAQAVRFLTSLRHHSPSATTEAQRDFLKSKGLDDAAIENAFRDAERPAAITGPGAPAPGELTESAAFDQAARAFEDPIHQPAPTLPAKNYPRSPLALYYQEAQDRVAEAIRRDESARRYNVLLSFFRTLTWLLTVGGGLAAVSVALWKAIMLPRLVTTLNCRSYLLKHHHRLWDNVVGSVQALRQGKLVPSEKEIRDEAKEDRQKDNPESRRAGGKKVQFADEVDGGELEQREGEVATSKGRELGEKQPLLSKEEEGEQDEAEGGDEEVEAEPSIQPIDLCEPVRTSLAALSRRLRQDSPQSDTRPPASVQEGSDDEIELGDGADSSGSDSWQDDDEEDAEFDPFVEMKNSKKKSSTTSKRRNNGAGPKANRKHSPPSSTNAAGANPSTAAATMTTSPGSNLYTSLVDLNSSIHARHLATQSKAFRLGSNTSFAFAHANANKTIGGGEEGGGGAGGGKSTTSGDANSEEKVSETAAQIRAEIRSLKGLLLSRRNFPRHALQSQSGS